MPISKIKSGSILDGTIQSGDIAPATIDAPNLAPGIVNASNITPGSITTSQISPSAAIAVSKLANSSISVNGSSISLGGTGTVAAGTQWQAVTVADGSTQLNTSAGKGYFLDTNAGVIEVFLPSSPNRGDTVTLVDYGGQFSTNKVIVNTGGTLIDSTAGGPGSSNDFEIKTSNIVIEFIYANAAKGWITKRNTTIGNPLSAVGGVTSYGAEFISATGGTVTTSGDFKIHTFTGDGCFVVSALGNEKGSGDKVSYMVVGGGGGGGRNHGGSGGAGGFREGKVSSGGGTDSYCASPLDAGDGLQVSVTTYPITVGGGSGGGSPSTASPGSASSFSTISSAGGGGGGGRNGGNTGGSGGSGGGGSHGGGGGSGNSPPVNPPQGNPGHSASGLCGGRGGSAANPGGGTSRSVNTGVTSNINGCAIVYSSAGGAGGHGVGSTVSPSASNTGGSGYGGHSGFGGGGSGKSGVVVIRYKYQ